MVTSLVLSAKNSERSHGLRAELCARKDNQWLL
jgi:hypothetical protein